MRAAGRHLSLAFVLLLSACGQARPQAEPDHDPASFPRPDRPVSPIVSSRWSTEPERDLRREASAVIAAAKVEPGMSVADIGAGEGYYTVRLARIVGAKGRVLAEDIVPAYHDALALRVSRERLDNVSVVLGKANNPRLPPASFDRIFMVHMYHEIDSPYEFLWNIRPALKPGGRIIIVDADRPTAGHGMPPKLLRCEFAAVGLAQVEQKAMAQAQGFFAAFQAVGPRPEPSDIHGCAAQR